VHCRRHFLNICLSPGIQAGRFPTGAVSTVKCRRNALRREPIDSLQSLFDTWLATSTGAIEKPKQLFRLYPNPARDLFAIDQIAGDIEPTYSLRILDGSGRVVMETRYSGPRMEIPTTRIGSSGLYLVEVWESTGKIVFAEKLALLE
jgi:hypothetical protein